MKFNYFNLLISKSTSAVSIAWGNIFVILQEAQINTISRFFFVYFSFLSGFDEAMICSGHAPSGRSRRLALLPCEP